MPRQPCRAQRAMTEMAPDRPDEHRLPAEEAAAPALAVAAPELLAGADPADRPPRHARERHAQRHVEPDDGVGALEDEVAELAGVVAVDDPAVRVGRRGHAPPELLDRRLRPAGAVVEGVELDMRHAEALRELPRDGRLPTPARPDHGDLRRHEASRYSRRMEIEPGRVVLADEDLVADEELWTDEGGDDHSGWFCVRTDPFPCPAVPSTASVVDRERLGRELDALRRRRGGDHDPRRPESRAGRGGRALPARGG